MIFRSKVRLAALGGLALSSLTLLVHLFLAKYSSANLVQYSELKVSIVEINLNVGGRKGTGYRKLWKNVKSLESVQAYSNPQSTYPGVENNGFIYAKIFGGFEKIRSSVCDLITISRLLNATLVIPEIQESTHTKGMSSKFKSFSYLYNEEQFIAGLKNYITIVKSLPPKLRLLRKQNHFPIFKPRSSASPTFYIKEVLPKLRETKVVGLVLYDGGCLQPVLPSGLAEYRRLRRRFAFHALHFLPETQHLMVERKYLAELFNEEGLETAFHLSKPTSFLCHPIPECSCKILKIAEIPSSDEEGITNGATPSLEYDDEMDPDD